MVTNRKYLGSDILLTVKHKKWWNIFWKGFCPFKNEKLQSVVVILQWLLYTGCATFLHTDCECFVKNWKWIVKFIRRNFVMTFVHGLCNCEFYTQVVYNLIKFLKLFCNFFLFFYLSPSLEVLNVKYWIHSRHYVPNFSIKSTSRNVRDPFYKRTYN